MDRLDQWLWRLVTISTMWLFLVRVQRERVQREIETETNRLLNFQDYSPPYQDEVDDLGLLSTSWLTLPEVP